MSCKSNACRLRGQFSYVVALWMGVALLAIVSPASAQSPAPQIAGESEPVAPLPPPNFKQLNIEVPSSLDKTPQPCRLDIPHGYAKDGEPVPLVVLLHSWSGDYRQGNGVLERLVAAQGWLCLMPNFRGPNLQPEACASALAQQDILDAIDWVCQRYRIDQKLIYLCGSSGGGHMTMMMAGRHGKRFRAASAWVGISDLAAWHQKHERTRYGDMLRKSCGGRPGQSQDIDAQYRNRAPIHFLKEVGDLPLDLAAGIHDGHKGSVPIVHTLNAFNAIAQAQGAAEISPAEIEQLSALNGRLQKPHPTDEGHDEAWARDYYLRRSAGSSRVTIFEGGHEGIPAAMLAWFLSHPQDEKTSGAGPEKAASPS